MPWMKQSVKSLYGVYVQYGLLLKEQLCMLLLYYSYICIYCFKPRAWFTQYDQGEVFKEILGTNL